MFACRKAKGMIAAALYEPPSPDESSWLEAHLATCATCRLEAESLRVFSAQLPSHPVAFTGDLLPALREQLRQTGGGVPLPSRLRLFKHYAAAATLTLAAGVTIYYATYSPALKVSPSTVEVLASPAERMLAEANALAKHDFAGARQVLEDILAAYPKDPRAGDAQLALARLEYNHGQRYAEAYTAYDLLRKRYPETWKTDPQNIQLFNLLDEARAYNFEPLYQIDAAKNASSDSLHELETVIAHHPGGLLANLAVDAMVAALQQDAENAPSARFAALETLRQRCTLPSAVAQVTLALADTCRDRLNDDAKARPYYDAVAQSGDAQLAPIARQALARLETPPTP